MADLRTTKTLRALREAFLGLRRELPLERVTVRALCERAEIGKATFYLHYHSIYDLSDELQRDLVSRVVDEVGAPETLLEQPAETARLLCRAFERRQDEVDALFSCGQEHRLSECLEAELRRRLGSVGNGTVKSDVLLTYLVAGGYQAYARFAHGAGPEERECIVDAIGEASAAVSRLV
ncbi:TetR/AcrR family transcriptional regulator [Olsenella profusa]|uniref:TetR/AcrR family transcriptional regulator n=1 Tax=Olsenella profusa TaxID=138595 RepID=A0ABS2F0W7_9ACTN|nr:TetR family transcriptional regulator [Olsenella profusa]MBM6774233.1 TetR/AcrR family transcriptional regulator [Olsenella profusa]